MQIESVLNNQKFLIISYKFETIFLFFMYVVVENFLSFNFILKQKTKSNIVSNFILCYLVVFGFIFSFKKEKPLNYVRERNIIMHLNLPYFLIMFAKINTPFVQLVSLFANRACFPI
jgi:hypothetical protein